MSKEDKTLVKVMDFQNPLDHVRFILPLMKTTERDYEVAIRWSEPDQLFAAYVVEMPGVMADGLTRADAAREIEAALEATIEAADAHGHPLPEARRLTPAA